jgi:hypothetical protein
MMKSSLIVISLLSFSVVAFAQFDLSPNTNFPGAEIQGDQTATMPFHLDPDFWLATSANLAGIGLFLARVYSKHTAKGYGYATEALGAPALVLATLDLVNHTTDFSTLANLGYASWALFAVTVDHILKVEYRNPFRNVIIIPYVTTYFLGIGSMSAAQVNNGYLPWGIAGVTCIINVGASFYSRSKGGDR